MNYIEEQVTEAFRQDTAVEGSRLVTVSQEQEGQDTEEWLGFVGPAELDHIIAGIEAGTASGLDGFPASDLKNLGPDQRRELRGILSRMLETGRIPKDWCRGRMLFLYKGAGERSNFASYRPITVTPVLYRVYAQVLRRRIQAWAEREGLLGELQNGFRRRRCIEDNLFILTQCVELARAEGRQLWAAFLDLEKAYDTVQHATLWDVLRTKGLPEEVVRRLQALYTDTEVVVEWQGSYSRPVPIGRGLRQGCPLSPLLFMLLLGDLEKDLEGSESGFDVSYMEDGRTVNQRLPGLMYVDDIVVTAGYTESWCNQERF